MITSDTASAFGCTATIIKALPGGPGSCTGPSTDKKAEWPALTTNGAPVAGPGTVASDLGAVQRAGIGDQVTYNGHPLYLFDQGPGQVTGEEWDEPSLPPWHGIWYVVSPAGNPLAWSANLTTTTVGKKTVLATLMFTGIGWAKFPVYEYTSDTATSSHCAGECAVYWPPLLTSGVPATTSPVSHSLVSSLGLAGGLDQVTYNGHPLYLFANEQIVPMGESFVATGNGNGATVGGGTFKLVAA
jgi:predicted lipoprotein with Yx(FWY)xxD motif